MPERNHEDEGIKLAYNNTSTLLWVVKLTRLN
jgi:hypothetical protein